MRTSIFLETKKGPVVIQATELLYITIDPAKNHTLCFVTKEEKHYASGDLNDFEDTSQSWLFRCHRSFIVNLYMIREINKYDRNIYFLEDHSNNSCPFSRRKYATLKDSLKDFLLAEQEV